MRSYSVVTFALFIFRAADSLRTDQQYWNDLAKQELEEALQLKWNTRTAKNVIVFVGDGMGPNTVTATRMYKGGESHRLVYEKFPHIGLLKTYSADKMVPDSACTATALFSGVKINKDTVGVDASVMKQDCARSLLPEARLTSLAAAALADGKAAGFVTTMRVTHATPSPLYAHSADRVWECDAFMPETAKECKDIARQLVEDEPGKNLNVILGGGRNTLAASPNGSTNAWDCARRDGRNLIEEYKKDKESRGLKYSVVMNNGELQNFNENETDYLMGIFANSHMEYEYQKDKGPEGMPTISDMVEAAIKVLRRNSNGYFLMVEGGNIDMAHHRGRAKVAVNESAAMEDAVALAMTMIDEEDTLLIVTSDHTHTLSINGYPDRGTSVFGIAQPSYDGVNYTTLSYGVGGPEAFQFYVKTVDNETTVMRREPSLEDTESMDYHQIAAIRDVESAHGGGDVAIYARGPHAHLFHNVHEQHYVYHAVMHATKWGHSGAISCAASIVTLVSMLITVVVQTF
ncbi:alkaline phosphatase isoform X2 [Ostrinia nubilalis]|uniref:alkaline phosphatase isoform X1 n=1 Tax=Ostrinia nubilalis TaxID=29057 RepID=UPI0030823C62